MLTPRERYFRDPLFQQVVDTLYRLIENAQMTPTEIREAAMLAQIKYEEIHPRPIVSLNPRTEGDV